VVKELFLTFCSGFKINHKFFVRSETISEKSHKELSGSKSRYLYFSRFVNEVIAVLLEG